MNLWVDHPSALWKGRADLLPSPHQTANENGISVARLLIVGWLLLVLVAHEEPWAWWGGAGALAAWWALQKFGGRHGKGGGGARTTPPAGAKNPLGAGMGTPHVGDPADLSDIPGARSGVGPAVQAQLSPLVGTTNDPLTGLNPRWTYAPMDAAPLLLAQHPKRVVPGQPYGSTPEATEWLGNLFKDQNELILDRTMSFRGYQHEAANRTAFIENVNAGLTLRPKDKYGDPARARLDQWWEGPLA